MYILSKYFRYFSSCQIGKGTLQVKFAHDRRWCSLRQCLTKTISISSSFVYISNLSTSREHEVNLVCRGQKVTKGMLVFPVKEDQMVARYMNYHLVAAQAVLLIFNGKKNILAILRYAISFVVSKCTTFSVGPF